MAYNTTPFHGKLCRVEKNDVAMDYGDGWSINASVDMADISRSGQHWKEGLPGMAGWNGSFSGHLVAGNTEQKAFLDNIIAATPVFNRSHDRRQGRLHFQLPGRRRTGTDGFGVAACNLAHGS